MRFEQRGDRPDEVFYHLTLRESPPPPPPPDPLGGIDTSLLDEAAGFVDGVTDALDALDALANLPDFSDPTALLGGTLDQGHDGARRPWQRDERHHAAVRRVTCRP